MQKIRALTSYSGVNIRDQQDPSCDRALFYRLILGNIVYGLISFKILKRVYNKDIRRHSSLQSDK